MKQLVFDIETDDVKATKVWCICTLDVDTGEEKTFTYENLDEGVEHLEGADKLIGHNIIGFDVPVLEKLTGAKLSGKNLVDTLVLSRLFNPVREGGHGLESWGYALGVPKIEFDEYQTFSQDMLDYCVQDVRLNFRVFQELKKLSKGFTPEAVKIEMETYKIICRQRDKGFMLDIPRSEELLSEINGKMDDVVVKVHQRFEPKKQTRYLYPQFSKTGSLMKTAIDNFGKNTRLGPIEFSQMEEAVNANGKNVKIPRVELTDFNLGSRKQIGEYLMEFGWEPKVFTPTGQPQVDEKILSKVDIPEAALICDYLMYQKRIAQIESWLKAVENSRVHGFVNSNGTITGRMTHNSPNLAQVPSSNSPYGKDCRACWTVPRGYKLVGIDASGLELRMLAHYLNDEDYTNEIVNGDVHTANQRSAGLESRNQAKTFIYALLYGAGNEKLGSVAGGGAKLGSRLRKSFFDNLPAFSTLTTRVERAAAKGYLKGIDGRKVFIRSKHAALNSLLQSAGAIVMKKALIIFNEKIAQLDAHFVANVHDEWQIEAEETIADSVGNLGVESIIQAGVELNLNCPLDGEYNVGSNWSETH